MMSGLAAFDMDGTLIKGRLVFALADKFGLSEKVKQIQSGRILGYEQTKTIAALFAGLMKRDIEVAIESLPLTKNCERLVAALKERNFKIGIISDSYTVAADFIAHRLHLDFVAANELQVEKSLITGKVAMPLGWEKIGCFCKISVCKRYHLEKFSRKFGVNLQNTLAVGDTRSDNCMIERAGIGIAFMPKDKEIVKATNKIVRESDLLKVLEFVV